MPGGALKDHPLLQDTTLVGHTVLGGVYEGAQGRHGKKLKYST